jgi:flagellar secretion chaperone FliS
MNGIASYRNARVETASPLRVVVMLYQEVQRRIELGAVCLDRNDLAGAGPHFHHAQQVLTELRCALAPAPGAEELVGRLDALYKWCSSELVAARVNKDPGRARQAGKVLLPVLDAWNEVLSKGLA